MSPDPNGPDPSSPDPSDQQREATLREATGYRDASRVREALRRAVPDTLREDVRFWLLDTPRVSEVYTALDPRLRGRRVSSETELVIDGFARSGNSYAMIAFVHANGPDHRVTSHLHTARVFERAAALGLPAIALIREPADVLGSTLQFSGHRTAESVLALYLDLYRRVERVLDHVVLSDFPGTTGDFGAVIRRCNERFGTSFVPYERTEEHDAEVFAMIDQATRTTNPDRFEETVGRPSGARRRSEDFLAGLTPHEQRLLAEARDLHARLVAAGGGPR